jgi:hypothetical protein
LKIIIPISVGELLDKISILQIKSKYTDNSFVQKELEHLVKVAKENQVYDQNDINSLLEVNQKLWNIEDELRLFEKKHLFNEDFIQLARLVYTYNDQRAEIKKQINQKYKSEYQEVKCYV